MILLIVALVWLGLGALTCLLFAAIIRGGGGASTCYDLEAMTEPQPEPTAAVATARRIPKPRAASTPAAKPARASV